MSLKKMQGVLHSFSSVRLRLRRNISPAHFPSPFHFTIHRRPLLPFLSADSLIRPSFHCRRLCVFFCIGISILNCQLDGATSNVLAFFGILQEEIGAVFHQLEASSKQGRTISNVVPPPVPVRRVHHLSSTANKSAVNYSQRRRAGLKVTEDYYIGDLELTRRSRVNNYWNRKLQQQQQQQLHPILRGRNRWDAEFQRRTSCPGLQQRLPNNELFDAIDTVGLMTTADGGDVDVQGRGKKKKVQQPNPRRTLRRYLTADSALKLTDNGHDQQQHRHHTYQPYHPQAIQVWTTSLMAEFNHIIDGELQRLATSTPCESVAVKRAVSSERLSELSPWARMQLALIDPASASSPGERFNGQLPSAASPDLTSIQQLSADIDLVERQIFDDLDDLTLTLNQSLPSSSSSNGGCDAPSTDESSAHLSSPLLVSFFFPFLLISSSSWSTFHLVFLAPLRRLCLISDCVKKIFLKNSGLFNRMMKCDGHAAVGGAADPTAPFLAKFQLSVCP